MARAPIVCWVLLALIVPICSLQTLQDYYCKGNQITGQDCPHDPPKEEGLSLPPQPPSPPLPSGQWKIKRKFQEDFLPPTTLLVIPHSETWLIDKSVTKIESRCIIVRGALIAASWQRGAAGVLPFAGNLEILLNDELPLPSDPLPDECQQDHFHSGRWDVTQDNPATLAVAKDGQLLLKGKDQERTWTTLAAPAAKGSATLTVNEDLADWGTEAVEVVLGSTDFDPKYTETLLVKVNPSNSKELQVQSSTVQWYHHGSELSDTIDVERAPVGLLTHNIKIVGKTETGAHSVAFPGFDSTVVSGVEFRNMGRKHLGNYPWHWHMTGDLSTGVERAIFDGNSIHDSIFRCLSIHQTSGTKVRNNVMYNISGHCVYIEDGIWEENNVISKNLVLGVKSVREQFHHGVETSDMLTVPGEGGGSPLSQSWVASFWIKSLKNTIQDNWVGSSFGVGFWTAPCNFVGAINTPRDMWQGLPTFPAFAATLGFHQQFQGFEGNTMHSIRVGFFNDGAKNFNPTFRSPPTVTPQITSSEERSRCRWGGTGEKIDVLKAFSVEDLTVFKSQEVGFWVRAARVTFIGGTWSDTRNGIETLQGGTQPEGRGVYRRMTFIGYSANKGNVDDTSLLECETCTDATCKDATQCKSQDIDTTRTPGGTRVMSNARHATEDTYEYNNWYPPLHVSFVLYDGPDVFLGTGNRPQDQSTYWNFDDERYCFAAPRRAPTIFLMTPATGWADLPGDLASQTPPDSDKVKRPTVEDMLCMVYPRKVFPLAEDQSEKEKESNLVLDDNRRNMVLAIGSNTYTPTAQPILARDNGFYTSISGITCADFRPESNTVVFRNKGGLALCHGKKMIGAQIRTFFVDGHSADPGMDYLIKVTSQTGKSSTFSGAFQNAGKQLSIPVYVGERYIIQYSQPFNGAFNKKAYSDIAKLGFLALFHADKGDWVEFEIEGVPEQACDSTSFKFADQNAQVPDQPARLMYLKYNPEDTAGINFQNVPEADSSNQNKQAVFKVEDGKCILRLTEQNTRPSNDDTAGSFKYGMCYSPDTITAHQDGLFSCPMIYFDNEVIKQAMNVLCGSGCGPDASSEPTAVVDATSVPTAVAPAAVAPKRPDLRRHSWRGRRWRLLQPDQPELQEHPKARAKGFLEPRLDMSSLLQLATNSEALETCSEEGL